MSLKRVQDALPDTAALPPCEAVESTFAKARNVQERHAKERIRIRSKERLFSNATKYR